MRKEALESSAPALYNEQSNTLTTRIVEPGFLPFERKGTMASESAQNPPSAQPVRGRGKLLLRVAQLGGFLLLVSLILFAGSGRLGWLL
jgi:hypothetical protein